MGDGDLGVRLIRDGNVLRVECAGRVGLDGFLSAMSEARELENPNPSTATLMDFRAVEGLELDDEEVLGLVVALRSRFKRNRDYRYAVLAPPEVMARMAGEFVRARDLVAVGEADVPEVRGFADEAEAMAWLREAGTT